MLGGKMTWKRGALIALGVTVVAYPVAWLFVRYSDAFEEAERFVREDPVVREHVGEIRTFTLPFFGAEMSVSGSSGDAKFDLNVSGSANNAVVYAELRKRGVWEVQFARLLREKQSPILLYSASADLPIDPPDAA
jgi:Cytochrome oxidase complex assembly protein 1